MSYEIERIAITNYLSGQSFFGLKPFGLNGGSAEMKPGAGFMTILHGAAQIRSTGAAGSNLHDYVGVLAITILSEAEDVSSANEIADTAIAAMTGLRIDENGTTPTSGSAVVISFEAQGGLRPYIAESRAESPFHRVVVNAPFIRTERK